MTDFSRNCQKCGKNDKSVAHREMYMPNYQGPCADSFCYASCDSSSCRAVHVSICDLCASEIDTARAAAALARLRAKHESEKSKAAAEAAEREPAWMKDARAAGWTPPRSRR